MMRASGMGEKRKSFAAWAEGMYEDLKLRITQRGRCTVPEKQTGVLLMYLFQCGYGKVLQAVDVAFHATDSVNSYTSIWHMLGLARDRIKAWLGPQEARKEREE